MNILLVEDNRDIAELIFDYFEADGVTLDYAATGKQGLNLALEHDYDCIILDIMLPGIDGLTICQILRETGKNTPIIMLTARDTKEDLLDGLNGGADDYLVKPFALEILEARVRALIRRADSKRFCKKLSYGPLCIETDTRKVYREKRSLKLNPTCYEILTILAKQYPEPASRAQIERRIWKDESPDDDVLRKHIYQLRNIVDKPFAIPIIKTIPKYGYALDVTL